MLWSAWSCGVVPLTPRETLRSLLLTEVTSSCSLSIRRIWPAAKKNAPLKVKLLSRGDKVAPSLTMLPVSMGTRAAAAGDQPELALPKRPPPPTQPRRSRTNGSKKRPNSPKRARRPGGGVGFVTVRPLDVGWKSSEMRSKIIEKITVEYSWYRVETFASPGLTSRQPFQADPAALENPIPLYGLVGIVGAAGKVPTR